MVQMIQRVQRGFSLVEIMVVVGVMIILSTITLVYTSSTRGLIALSVEQAHTAQFLSRVKSQALASYAQAGTVCGYGMYIADTETMELFAYDDGADCVAVDAAGIRNAGNRTVNETNVLSQNVDFNTASGIEAVLFVPPDPTTYYIVRGDGNLNPGGSGNIELTIDSGDTAVVRVSAAGQITF